MPFEVKPTLFEKIKIAILKFLFSLLKNQPKNQTFNWVGFTAWLEKSGINVPFAFQIMSLEIKKLNAQRMIKDNESRIGKVEKTHEKKYKIDRHNYNSKVNTVSFKDHITSLTRSYTHLYIKYVVGRKDNGNFKQENFTLYFGGISKDAQGYFLTTNAGSFKTLNSNGTLIDAVDDTIKKDTTFKDKNDSLNADGFPEFNECEMSGLIHFLKSEGTNLGVLNWINGYIGTQPHFYIKIGCNQKDNDPTTPDPTVVSIAEQAGCNIEYLTSPIFTTDSNLKVLSPPPSDSYYDAGTGCCP